MLHLSSQRISSYTVGAMDLSSLGMGLLRHAYWLVSCPIPSCLLPFAQEEAGSALQVRDTLQQDPDTAPDNTVIRSKLLCR